MGILRGIAFLSTIALSLCWGPAALSQSGVKQLEHQLQQKVVSPEKKGWQLNPQTIPQDQLWLKGQAVSLIDWEEDPDEATDISRWITNSQVQEKSPDWLVRLRNARQMELVGKILACSGSCQIVRGLSTVSGQYLSQILEGDELTLEEDSTAWVYLIDGGLLRLAAQTTVSFQEINFSQKEVLIYLKLLQGHVHYLPRSVSPETIDLGPQTDAHALPLMLEVANEAYFARQIFQEQNDKGHLQEYLFYDKHFKTHQFKFLNELKLKNNEGPSIKTTLIMASPNMTITSPGVSFDMVYLFGGKGFVKKKSEGSLELSLRGYHKTSSYEISEDHWIQVIENGRGFDQLSSENRDLELLELLTKRVVSFKTAQEVWYQKFTLPILEKLSSQQELAQHFGYFLWTDQFTQRKKFLEEYIRRLETTHLQSLGNLVAKMENRGERIEKVPTNLYYQKALDAYLWSLKNKYNFDQQQIRETNNLQYYVWILKNVKSKKK